MKHRLAIFAVLSLCSSMALGATAGSAPEKKMNVLFLVVDDLNTLLLGDTNRYAGKVVAPHITRLAESGVMFTRTYAASPKCSPSRTAFLSGVGPWKSGVYDNGYDVKSSAALKGVTSLPAYFRQHGYYAASYGKVGHGWFEGELDDSSGHKRDPVLCENSSTSGRLLHKITLERPCTPPGGRLDDDRNPAQVIPYEFLHTSPVRGRPPGGARVKKFVCDRNLSQEGCGAP